MLNDSDQRVVGEISMPTVTDSNLPGLLGLTTLRKKRSVIDTTTGKIYMLGPGDCDLLKAMPPGTEVYQCEYAPSGHLILPCAEFAKGASQASDELILHTRVNLHTPKAPSVPPPAPLHQPVPVAPVQVPSAPPSYSAL